MSDFVGVNPISLESQLLVLTLILAQTLAHPTVSDDLSLSNLLVKWLNELVWCETRATFENRALAGVSMLEFQSA